MFPSIILQQHMTSKQLVGTGRFVTHSSINMTIPVQESFLPVQKIKEPTLDMPKESIYDHDARNLHFKLTMKCNDGLSQTETTVSMGKEQMYKFFQQIEKIQDQLNSYS